INSIYSARSPTGLRRASRPSPSPLRERLSPAAAGRFALFRNTPNIKARATPKTQPTSNVADRVPLRPFSPARPPRSGRERDLRSVLRAFHRVEQECVKLRPEAPVAQELKLIQDGMPSGV